MVFSFLHIWPAGPVQGVYHRKEENGTGKAELDKQTALAEAEVKKVNAETEAAVAIERARGAAEVQRITAEAEAEANRILSQSITPELIEMTEMEARKIHGWVTVQGVEAVVTE